ncbi:MULTISPECIES: porin [unclassified Cupriavidus]|uniref:porin n=1 Tax=unclassified Cupriavidus TaxID=2640874 RepID=UPI00313C57FD
MKLSRIAVSACFLALPLGAYAQSVTLYGVVDTGVEFVNHVGTNGNGLVRMPNLTGTVPSRWGMRGSEDLGGGIKSVFVLESGFAPDSGNSNQGGRLFGRQAFVGLNGQWGQIAFGRQYSMLFWATLDTDTLGPNAFGSGSIDSYLPNARHDNAVTYKGKFGGFTVGATYSLGRDTVRANSISGTNCAGENPADVQACRAWSALLMYETPQWGTHVAYDSQRGGADAFGGLTSSSLKDDRLSVGGYALFSSVKVGLGVINRNNEGSANSPGHSQLYYAGASYDVTPAFNVASEVFYVKFSNSPNKAWLGAMRGSYSFSKRTLAYATVGYIDNRGSLALSVSNAAGGSAPVAGANQFGAMLGIKQIF